ncbi:predicted protein [Botrytis cinerea T4]|uniref:Uncharacterized protein n=1 Tax=Botryotinia fuckeliana (strain T4) TaxID=999810 RepID=G2XU26_BOTF4|nr:predicted protein [Botrytis cinerea T4]
MVVSILLVKADRQRAQQTGMSPLCKSSPKLAMSILRRMTAVIIGLLDDLLRHLVYS